MYYCFAHPKIYHMSKSIISQSPLGLNGSVITRINNLEAGFIGARL